MRRLPQWLRALLAALPFLSIFFFPWRLSVLALFLAGLVFPPLALIAGVLADILYYPGEGWYTGTLTGFLLCVVTYAVRYLYRTRIM